MANPVDLSIKPEERTARRFRQIEEDNGYAVRARKAGGAGAGATGAPGANGATWYSGAGAPGAGEGANGDFYLRTSNEDVYKKSGGTWSVITNIKGEKGATGSTGAEGTAGTNGETGPAGTAAPAAALATAAALPANTRTTNVIEANAVGVWTIDGVTLSVNQIILVKNEATGANNGVYKVVTVGTAGVKTKLERDTTMNESAKAVPGMIIYVARGTANADSVWQLATDPTITLNTTALVFTPVSNFTEIIPQTTGEVSLTESYADLGGATYTTPFPGIWSVRAYFDWQSNSSAFLIGIVLADGSNLGPEAHWNVTGRMTTSMEYKTEFLAAGKVIKLQARRAGGTTSPTYSSHTRLVVQRTI